MAKAGSYTFEHRSVDQLKIRDERSFRHVALYAELKQILQRSAYPFRILPAGFAKRLDRALLLNLTFWSAQEGGDVLTEPVIEADVITHVAWHHLAARALANKASKPSVEALFLGEAIASAFDLYLVGRLLGHAPQSSFLASQVPAMAEAADAAGMRERDFERMLRSIVSDPERAFADLRALLYDATRTLYACASAEQGHAALAALDAHRFSALLHRYELSNWVLYARAHGSGRADPRARRVDKALREESSGLDWLAQHWLAPALR